VQAARDRIRELTTRKQLLLTVEEVEGNLNLFLRGWAGYFRYGNSARHLHKIRNYDLGRLAIFVASRTKKPRTYGWKTVAYPSPGNLGLLNLNWSVVAPRPNRPWRVKQNAAGEGRW
jgi:RNA-directed DNA polymerase